MGGGHVNPYYEPYWLNEDELEHYGVKGMKWGVRHEEKSIGAIVKAKQQQGYSVEGRKNYLKRVASTPQNDSQKSAYATKYNGNGYKTGDRANTRTKSTLTRSPSGSLLNHTKTVAPAGSKEAQSLLSSGMHPGGAYYNVRVNPKTGAVIRNEYTIIVDSDGPYSGDPMADKQTVELMYKKDAKNALDDNSTFSADKFKSDLTKASKDTINKMLTKKGSQLASKIDSKKVESGNNAIKKILDKVTKTVNSVVSGITNKFKKK